jgi:hypothetical protein
MHGRSLTAHRGTILAALVALLPLTWHLLGNGIFVYDPGFTGGVYVGP